MKKKYLLSLVAFLVFASCTKSGVNENDTPASPKNMLVFNNEDDLQSTLTKVSNMTDDEVKAYQSQNGYESFAQIAEEVYYSVDPDSFTSEQEMLDFLEANKDYITLETEDNGGFTARPAFHDNMYKHLINEDQMFEIDGLVYKVFQDGMVSAPKDQMNELLALCSENLKVIQSTNKFTYVPFQCEPLTKATLVNQTSSTIVGENRVRMTVTITDTTDGGMRATCHIEIDRERWLGWFAKRRDLVLDGLITYTTNGWWSGREDLRYKRTAYVNEVWYSFDRDGTDGDAMPILAWSFTASTPATGVKVEMDGII